MSEEIRYPDEWFEPSLDDAHEARLAADHVFDWLRASMPMFVGVADIDQMAAVGNEDVGFDSTGGNQGIAAAVNLEDGHAFQRRRLPAENRLQRPVQKTRIRVFEHRDQHLAFGH